MNLTTNPQLVTVDHLSVRFPLHEGLFSRGGAWIDAVSDVSFAIDQGEALGLVGESGCGKSTTGRAMLLLVRPTGGSIQFAGTELTELSPRELRGMRRRMQIIFQDPYASLDPRMRVGDAIHEALKIHHIAEGSDAEDKVREALEAVALDAEARNRFPHEFSGGQRQRIAIARALVVNPVLLICDEPISALDVSIQAQVINLFEDLQERYGLTYLFIAHDLAVVRHISNRIAVMYLGKIVEICDRDSIYERPLHPYTKALISAIPRPDPQYERSRRQIVLKGEPPSPTSPPTGCRFNTRCPYVRERCRVDEPELVEAVSGHKVACHYWREIAE